MLLPWPRSGGAVAAVGLASRLLPVGSWIWDKSIGDVCYAVMIGFMVAFWRPAARGWVIGAITLAVCFAIEGLPADRAAPAGALADTAGARGYVRLARQGLLRGRGDGGSARGATEAALAAHTGRLLDEAKLEALVPRRQASLVHAVVVVVHARRTRGAR